jgi:hypothetical protein
VSVAITIAESSSCSRFFIGSMGFKEGRSVFVLHVFVTLISDVLMCNIFPALSIHISFPFRWLLYICNILEKCSHLREEYRVRALRRKCRGKFLDLRGNYRIFIICTLHQLLLGWLYQGYGRGIWHPWGRWEKHTEF